MTLCGFCSFLTFDNKAVHDKTKNSVTTSQDPEQHAKLNSFNNFKVVMDFSIYLSACSVQNPSKPNFNHFLFESICIVISTTCKMNPAAVSGFEDGLFPPFQAILQQDVQGSELFASIYYIVELAMLLGSSNFYWRILNSLAMFR